MSDLRQQLKQFEAAFKLEHGRDPSRDDIRNRPEIAQKYKQYQREKSAQTKKTANNHPPVASTSSAAAAPPPPASNPFKTPTKPKRSSDSRARHPARKEGDEEPSSDRGPASPSRRLSAGSSKVKTLPGGASSRTDSQRDPGSETQQQQQQRYVVANSPSKLRALAALHSTSGSPNKRSSPATATSSSRPAAPPLFFDAKQSSTNNSPQKKKAANPFASPQKGAFGAFEREEREKLRARRLQLKRQQQEEKGKDKASVRGGGGVLGPAAAGGTRVGAGWGSATSVPGGGEGGLFDRRASRSPAATESMDVDQVDDFFNGRNGGGGGGTLTTTPRRSSQTGRTLHGDQQDDDDDDAFDEALGPSPIKPLSSTSGNQKNGAVTRPFQSLMPDSPPPPPPSLASRRPSQSNPFLSAPTAASSSSTTRPVPFLVPLPSSTKSTATAGGGDATTIVPQKRSDPGASSYYADQPTRPSGGGGDAKRQKLGKGVAASKNGNGNGNDKGKGKGKGKTNGAANSSLADQKPAAREEGRKQQQKKKSWSVPEMAGEMILNLDDYDSEEPDGEGEGDEAGAEARTAVTTTTRTRRKKKEEEGGEQIVIRDKGWMARQKALEREKRYPPTSSASADGAEPQSDDEDGGEGETIDILAFDAADRRELDETFQDPSLFKTSRQPDLLSLLSNRPRSSRSRSRSRSRSTSPSTTTRRRQQADDQAQAAASLPADLAALLSLRTSPTKSQTSSFAAKERQVARLLGEPGTARFRGRGGGVKGLLDFASEDEDGDAGFEGGGNGRDEDDDWDEEVEGWEGAGEAMDGYYSGGGGDDDL
ncbi:hypothetical protein JCM8115_004751 [Rhodotorula mucilaginosa]